MTQCFGQLTFGFYEHKQLVADFKGGQIWFVPTFGVEAGTFSGVANGCEGRA